MSSATDDNVDEDMDCNCPSTEYQTHWEQGYRTERTESTLPALQLSLPQLETTLNSVSEKLVANDKRLINSLRYYKMPDDAYSNHSFLEDLQPLRNMNAPLRMNDVMSLSPSSMRTS